MNLALWPSRLKASGPDFVGAISCAMNRRSYGNSAPKGSITDTLVGFHEDQKSSGRQISSEVRRHLNL